LSELGFQGSSARRVTFAMDKAGEMNVEGDAHMAGGPKGRRGSQEQLSFNYAVALADGRERCKYCHYLIARGQLMIAVHDPRGDAAAFFSKHLACSTKSTLSNALIKYGALEHVPGVSELGLSERAALAAAVVPTSEADGSCGSLA
jgi:hypothetical protein